MVKKRDRVPGRIETFLKKILVSLLRMNDQSLRILLRRKGPLMIILVMIKAIHANKQYHRGSALFGTWFYCARIIPRS